MDSDNYFLWFLYWHCPDWRKNFWGIIRWHVILSISPKFGQTQWPLVPWHWHGEASWSQLTKSPMAWYFGLEMVESFHFPNLLQLHQCGFGSSYLFIFSNWPKWPSSLLHQYKFQVPYWFAGNLTHSVSPRVFIPL